MQLDQHRGSRAVPVPRLALRTSVREQDRTLTQELLSGRLSKLSQNLTLAGTVLLLLVDCIHEDAARPCRDLSSATRPPPSHRPPFPVDRALLLHTLRGSEVSREGGRCSLPAFLSPQLTESPKTAGAGLPFSGAAPVTRAGQVQRPRAGPLEARLRAGESGSRLQSFPTGLGARMACRSVWLSAAYLGPHRLPRRSHVHGLLLVATAIKTCKSNTFCTISHVA